MTFAQAKIFQIRQDSENILNEGNTVKLELYIKKKSFIHEEKIKAYLYTQKTGEIVLLYNLTTGHAKKCYWLKRDDSVNGEPRFPERNEENQKKKNGR